MAEIKSTLDLVMERTRHLSLSDEEKQRQSRDAYRKNIKGSVQKYLDNAISLDQFQQEFIKLQSMYDLSGTNELVQDILSRLNPDTDNQPLLILLKEVCRVKITTIEELLKKYRSEISNSANKRIQALKAFLQQNYRISGSSIFPNLGSDPHWLNEVSQIRTGVIDRIFSEYDIVKGNGCHT